MKNKASFWLAKDANTVQCTLCPRNCIIKNNKFGFCKTRGCVSGELITYYYGTGLPLSVESIESEAVYHYWPGASVLCVGNVGCMLRCNFCQNWQTSQVEFLDKSILENYTSSDIVDIAKKYNIKMISWTYNDPIVWHEFVIETSKLAKSHGIKILYKTSLFIEIEPLRQLIDYVDIFSISLKSLSPEFYLKYTGGGILEPVLAAIIEISSNKNKHLEISQLLVTGLNDSDKELKNTCNWIVNNVGFDIPLHFVGFHPAFKYNQIERTPPQKIINACEIAKSYGIKYVYSGNLLDSNFNHSYCSFCGNKIIERIGTKASMIGIDNLTFCNNCGANLKNIKINTGKKNINNYKNNLFLKNFTTYFWKNKECGVHVYYLDKYDDHLIIERLPFHKKEKLFLNEKIRRYTINRNNIDETGIIIFHNYDIKVLSLMDRAHFPVLY